MSEKLQAKRYLVTGSVQGVGYRYFAQRVAEGLGIAGYVKNLYGGSVEVYAIGYETQLREFREQLERGPSAAGVSGVAEEDVAILPRYADGFSIEFERW